MKIMMMDLEFAFPCHPGEYPLENQIIRDPRCRSKGIGIVFPSFRSHRVTPVTRGVRYSLVVLGTLQSFHMIL